MSYFKELQELEDQGIDLIEVLGQDRHIESPDDLRRIVSQLSKHRDEIHAELLHYLTYRRFAPEEARALWSAIMKHKGRMAELLRRPVGFRVAALDYLTTIHDVQLRHVRLIAKGEFDAILSFVNVDEVSGVQNRRYFNDVLAQEVHRSRRYESPLSLLILDLDDFKRFNDTCGHVEGDSLLRRFGRLLRDSTRQPDSVCRFGGDEFAVLLPQTNGPKARVLADRVLESVRRLEPAPGGDRPVRWPTILRGGTVADGGGSPHAAVTVSIGGATFPDDCDDAEELVALADQRCLDAKRRGKDRVVVGPDTGGGPAGGPDAFVAD